MRNGAHEQGRRACFQTWNRVLVQNTRLKTIRQEPFNTPLGEGDEVVFVANGSVRKGAAGSACTPGVEILLTFIADNVLPMGVPLVEGWRLLPSRSAKIIQDLIPEGNKEEARAFDVRAAEIIQEGFKAVRAWMAYQKKDDAKKERGRGLIEGATLDEFVAAQEGTLRLEAAIFDYERDQHIAFR